jgi:threonine dehydratase
LSTATPQRKDIPVTERQDVPAEATGDIDQPKHFRQLNCSNTPPYIRETPLDYSPYFSELSGANVYLKLENLQHTGSFKLRGAFNKLLSMSEEDRESGGVAASSGNHGAAIAYAMNKLGVTGPIFVPEQTSPTKVDAIKRAGGDVRFFGTDGLDTETHAREYAAEHGMVYLSPYNDMDVIAGQGTCGVEIAQQLAEVDAIFIAVGGGGLISGVGAFLKSVNPSVTVVSCQPAASAVMTESIKAGKILDLPSDPTLSDGTAGGIEAEAITFDICRDITDPRNRLRKLCGASSMPTICSLRAPPESRLPVCWPVATDIKARTSSWLFAVAMSAVTLLRKSFNPNTRTDLIR